MADISLESIASPPSCAAYGSYPVVGVGASAGGLEALEDLFRLVPPTSGMAYVVVQHLSPDFESKMDELLGRQTEIRIRRVEDGDAIEPDTIYLVPPRKDMILSSGRLHLTERDRESGVSLPIDHFFRSLAQDLGRHSVGVVLSGTGSDGSRGIRDIHDAGGLVVCQDPDTAKFDGMPNSALATGIVDLVLAPGKIPPALVEHCAAPPRMSRELDEEITPGLETIFRHLRRRADVDFSYYKESTIQRRLERRLAALDISDVETYAGRVAVDDDELDALYNDLLIGVTEFLRNPEAFAQLENTQVPSILDNVDPEIGARAWVAGCGTGEEAYSLAMLFCEALDVADRPCPIKIFATDIDPRSLEVASVGLYPPDAFVNVPRSRRERFFIEERDGYRVSPMLREKVVFAHHNVMKDAPFTRLDLISCRNLLIYFRPAAQKKVISLFHFGLKTGGTLFLGASETPGDLSDEFETIHKRWRVYQKRRDVQLEPGLRMALPAGGVVTPRPPRPTGVRWARSVPDSRALSLYDTLLERHMPPSFLVDSKHELLHSFGGAERYLRLRGGRPTAHILDLLLEDVKTAVSGALHKAAKDQKPVQYTGLAVQGPAEREKVRLTVEPLEYGRVAEPHFLIQLETMDEPPPPLASEVELDFEKMSREYIDSLEVELRFTKENLQATIEELETSNEELQAANEELVSSNEELQSTNEELQSVNEELYTVNAEYQKKIRELVELSSDVDNLLQSTQIGVVFLDEELRIRKLTSRASELFGILPQDVGRPFDHFSHRLDLAYEDGDFARVRAGETLECDTESRDGGMYLFRALPYRAGNDIRGVVITVVDIERVKRAEREVRQAVAQRERFLAMLSHELRNPMAALETAASLLEAETEATLCERAVETMVRQARHMARLLDDVLDVSRMRQDEIELRRTAVDLVAITRDSLETMESFAERHGVALELGGEAGPLGLEADPDRLKQIQLNLLRNAIRHSPRGATVRVELSREGEEAVLRVIDHGCGIASDKLEEIFEPFVQLDQPAGYGGQGLGLGLALARSIARAHGGDIRAESDGDDRGSCFVVRFPAHRVREASGRASARGTDAAPTSLVLVEDDPDNRELMAALLRRRGYAVEVAADGPSGLSKLDEIEPRIALVDLGLPGMDGLALARSARQRHARGDMFMVALTGHGQQRDRNEVFDAGFDQHLVKPVRIDTLISVLRQALGDESES